MVQVRSGSRWWRRVFGVVVVARLAGRWTEKDGLFFCLFVLGLLLWVAGGVWVVGGVSLLCGLGVVSEFLVVLCRKQGRYCLLSISSVLLFDWWFPVVVGWRIVVAGWMLQRRWASGWACVCWWCLGWSPLVLQEDCVSSLLICWCCICEVLLYIIHVCYCMVVSRWWKGGYGTGWAWICAVVAWWVRWLDEVWGLWLSWWVVVWCWGGVVFVFGSLVESDGWKLCSFPQVAAVQNPGFGGSSRRLMEYVSVACSYGLRRCRVVSIVVRLHLACRNVCSYGSVSLVVAFATSLQGLEENSGAFSTEGLGSRLLGRFSVMLFRLCWLFLFVFVLLFVLVVIRLWSSPGCNYRD